MDKEEIIEGNKLMAEFMGLNQGWSYHESQDKGFGVTKYHSSWDWLMHVVDKIDKLDFRIVMGLKDEEYFNSTLFYMGSDTNIALAFEKHQANFSHNSIITYGKENKLIAAYRNVVEFIKWYNSINNA